MAATECMGMLGQMVSQQRTCFCSTAKARSHQGPNQHSQSKLRQWQHRKSKPWKLMKMKLLKHWPGRPPRPTVLLPSPRPSLQLLRPRQWHARFWRNRLLLRHCQRQWPRTSMVAPGVEAIPGVVTFVSGQNIQAWSWMAMLPEGLASKEPQGVRAMWPHVPCQ